MCKWIGIWWIAFAGGSMEALVLHGSQVHREYSCYVSFVRCKTQSEFSCFLVFMIHFFTILFFFGHIFIRVHFHLSLFLFEFIFIWVYLDPCSFWFVFIFHSFCRFWVHKHAYYRFKSNFTPNTCWSRNQFHISCQCFCDGRVLPVSSTQWMHVGAWPNTVFICVRLSLILCLSTVFLIKNPSNIDI